MSRPLPQARIAIVGGGFTGAVVAAQLACRLAAPALVEVIEPRALLGAGVAYSASDPAHRINVPAARMTVFSDQPGDFDRWLRDTGALSTDPDAIWHDGSAFPQRQVFGRYVAAQVAAMGAARPEVTLRHRRARVESVTAHARGFTLRLDDGTKLPTDLLILAVSHPPPAIPAPLRAVAAVGAPVIADPWQAAALERIPADHSVLVVGTGLTMADVVASLARRGHRGPVLAVSRRGLLSRGHAFGPVARRAQFETVSPPVTARVLCGMVRQQVQVAAAEGAPWQAVLDDVRTHGRRLWMALPVVEQRRLVRHLRPYWDVHRFRVAPQVEAAITVLQAAGQFRALAASLRGARWDGGSISVTLAPRHGGKEITTSADTIVITTGPAHRGVLTANPALAALHAQHLVRLDDVGLGLAVDLNSRAVGRDGSARPDLLIVGPLARGRFGELMGLPQVSEHAADVAEAAATYFRVACQHDRPGASCAAADDALHALAAGYPPEIAVV